MRTIHVLRKPCSEGTVAANVLRYGTGALNVDGCRIAFTSEADERESKVKNQHADFGSAPVTGNVTYGDYSMLAPKNYNPPGRWPANVLHDGSVGVVSTFPDTGTSTGGRIGNASGAYANQGRTGWGMGHEAGDPGFGDAGSAARYFQVVLMGRTGTSK